MHDTYTRMHTHTHTYTHTHIHTHAHTHIHTHAHTHMHIHMYTCTHTHAQHTHTTHTCTHSHTHMCTHTCIPNTQPERIKLQSGKKGYDVRADIWSLGMSLVELATGGSPYNSMAFSTEFELLTHIVDAPPPLPDKSKFSTNFYNFIAQW